MLPFLKTASSGASFFEVYEIASVIDCQQEALRTVTFSVEVLGIARKRLEALPSHRGGNELFFLFCSLFSHIGNYRNKIDYINCTFGRHYYHHDHRRQ